MNRQHNTRVESVRQKRRAARAQICNEEREAIAAGYRESQRVARGPGEICPNPRNPFLQDSRMWGAFEFGYFLHESGRVLRCYQRGRGNTYFNPDGDTFRLFFNKKRGLWIERIA